MNYPERSKAIEILCEAEKLNPGPWVEHSKKVAHCAEAIASECAGMEAIHSLSGIRIWNFLSTLQRRLTGIYMKYVGAKNSIQIIAVIN